MRRTASKSLRNLEMRVARLEKSAKKTKFDIIIRDDYGTEYKSVSLKEFKELSKGGQFEFKSYSEGITITTKAYLDWHDSIDWSNYDSSIHEDFKGIERFDVSLHDLCEAYLTSIKAKPETSYY